MLDELGEGERKGKERKGKERGIRTYGYLCRRRAWWVGEWLDLVGGLFEVRFFDVGFG